MTAKDLLVLYDELKLLHGASAPRHLSALLANAKQTHYQHFMQSATAQRAQAQGRSPDHEQSWRSFKGKSLEKLIEYIIADQIGELNLALVNGNVLERNTQNLSMQLSRVKRNLLVDFGEFGCHLPDVDMIIYHPDTSEIVAVLSSKVTLRERIAQTAYWKLKLVACKYTQHIRVFFITLDEDQTLAPHQYVKKGRAIVHQDTDGCYVLTTNDIAESPKIKTFDHLISDILALITAS